jgi:probable DNA repair protein
MLHALPRVTRFELFGDLAGDASGGVTVITPGKRLAQAISREFAARRMGSGDVAWRTPDVLPFAAWVARFWSDALYSTLGSGLPLLLSTAQERACWEDCIRAAQREPLLSVAAAAEQAMQAWSLAHEWRIADKLAGAALHEDARAFVDWASRYERLTHERGQVDGARLPARVAALLGNEALRKPCTLVLAGFDALTPQQEAFLSAVEAAGASLSRLEPSIREAKVARTSFANSADELEAAARWARARLESDAAARIAVVVPQLGRERSRVERIFTRVLEPARPLASDSPRPFNISIGLPLSEWPVVHASLALLRLAGGEVPFEDASALLRSPFIAGSEGERAARDALDAAMRRRSGAHVTLEGLARLASGARMPPAPRLRALLESLADFRRSDLFARRGPAEWARAFEAALRLAGFPGERTLDSAEYQAWMKWHEALGDLASLERVAGAMGYGEARARLARIAETTLFQPETPDVPVQVLGLLESAGLDFDALWVTGLAEDAWPIPARVNPFIPLALQRAAGIPHADAAASLVLDERITGAWMHAANAVVFSHARMRDDAEIGPSALISAIEESPAVERPARVAGKRGRLERIADGAAPAVPEGARAGGTRLFRDQAACPFRAFARHRVSSEPPERPEPGLDAAARGTLLHEMLANVWRELEDKARLDSISDGALETLLASSADAAIGHCRHRLGEALSGRFEGLERERLIGTARDWLRLERARTPFSVVAIEEKREMRFGGITVNVKLDRMDRLEQGGNAVIDYKTGAAAVSSWLGPRPDEPQVPMYTLGSGEDVRVAAFARLKRGEMAFCGFGMEKDLVTGIDVVEKSRTAKREYASWSALLDGWRARLDALGIEFASGVARVDPKSATTCDQCDQHPFCRIAEKRPALEAQKSEAGTRDE